VPSRECLDIGLARTVDAKLGDIAVNQDRPERPERQIESGRLGDDRRVT
jgi:hypothetical protein